MRCVAHVIAPVATVLAFAGLSAFGVRQYEWNVSGLLHMDVAFGEAHSVPPGIVLYEDGGYDGMLYYQVARELPALLHGKELYLDSPYRFQRIVLPLLAFGLALGQEERIPFSMVLLNVAAAGGTLAVLLSVTKKVSAHVFAGVLNPAMFVGTLYTLTEPLSTFFLALFLARWLSNGRKIDAPCIASLALSLLARETTVFVLLFLGAWYAWRREWKQAVPLAIPVALFAVWQAILTFSTGSVPIETGGNMIGVPFSGPLMLLRWAAQETGMKLAYRLSSVALLVFLAGVCVALFAHAGRAWRERDPLWLFLLGLTVAMLCLHSHIWGAITSIGRVVAPLYPIYALYAADQNTRLLRALSIFLIALSIVAAVGIAAVRHPYVLS